MKNVLLVNVGNLGNPGIVMCLKGLLENFEAKYYYHKLTVCSGYERFNVVGSWKCWGYDLALDLGGDTFTTYQGSLQFLRHCLHLFLLVLFGQRFALFNQTFCSYGFFSKRIAKYFMGKACFITVREQRSKEILCEMGVPSILVGDIAFLLDSCDAYFDYVGGSYHRIISALLNGKCGLWDGSRSNNFKFDIFKEKLDLDEMKRRALVNVEVLQRFLS